MRLMDFPFRGNRYVVLIVVRCCSDRRPALQRMLSLPEQERYGVGVVLGATISTVYGRADQLPANDAFRECVGCGENMSISACCSTPLGTRKGLRK